MPKQISPSVRSEPIGNPRSEHFLSGADSNACKLGTYNLPCFAFFLIVHIHSKSFSPILLIERLHNVRMSGTEIYFRAVNRTGNVSRAKSKTINISEKVKTMKRDHGTRIGKKIPL
jgi:hypothetical protein